MPDEESRWRPGQDLQGVAKGVETGGADLNKSSVAMQIGKIIIDCRRMVALMGSRMSAAPPPHLENTPISLASPAYPPLFFAGPLRPTPVSPIPISLKGNYIVCPRRTPGTIDRQIPYLSRLHSFPFVSRPYIGSPRVGMDAANFFDTFGYARIIERPTIDTCCNIFLSEVIANVSVEMI